MTLEDLKNCILAEDLPNDLIIFKCASIDSSFLAFQYATEIAKIRGTSLHFVTDLQSLANESLDLIFGFENSVNVYRSDILDSWQASYSLLNNTIIICHKIDKKINETVADYVVDIPELLAWQVLDYMQIYCPGLTADNYNTIYTSCRGSIFRIINELDKISCFEIADRPAVFLELTNEANIDLHLTLQQETDLTNKILEHDMSGIYQYFKYKTAFNFDPVKIANLLLTSYRNILLITHNSGYSAADIGISDKQYWFIKKNRTGFLEKDLLNKINFLSSIELRLKTSKLELDKLAFIDYILCGVL